jgi:hypothetical protein
MKWLYYLWQTGITCPLTSGVAAPGVAEWAGHSVGSILTCHEQSI